MAILDKHFKNDLKFKKKNKNEKLHVLPATYYESWFFKNKNHFHVFSNKIVRKLIKHPVEYGFPRYSVSQIWQLYGFVTENLIYIAWFWCSKVVIEEIVWLDHHVALELLLTASRIWNITQSKWQDTLGHSGKVTVEC